MKNLNFSTKSGSQSGSHRIVTLASTVGSPSAHRRGIMLKLISVLVLILTIGVGQMWGADSGLTASAGTFVIDFYDSSKLSSTSGTGLTNNNYSSFVKVGTGLTKTNVVTSASVTGTVQYGKNGGLTAGTGTAAAANSHYVTFSTGTNFPVRKATVYATAYESGRWKLNGTTASSGSLGSKGATFANVSSPLVWNFSTYTNDLTFKKDNGSDGNQKRLTIYTIVCEYGYRANVTAPATGSITATPKTANENGAGWNSTLGAVVGLKSSQQVTLTATPPSASYILDSWTVKKTSDNSDVTSTVLGAGNSGVSPVTLTMPAYDVTISATWKLAVSCSNEITITKGTPSNGSFSMTPTGDFCIDEGNASVTISGITPSSGYRFKEITSSGGGTINNNAKTVTNISANTTINVVFEQIPPFTVSFVTGTGNSTQANIAEASSQAGITLPAGPSTIKCAADGWEFAGWSATNVSSETSTAPTILTAGSKYYPTDDCTLYAVYRKASVAANASSVTYTLSGNWTTNNGNWTKVDGSDLSSTLASGKYGLNSGSSTAVSPVSVTDISEIKFTGTKSNTGAGTVAFYYGSGSSWTLIESKDFGTSLTWSPSPTVTGQLKCVFSQSAGNIYIASIKVTGKFPSYTYISSPDCCIDLGSINGSVTMAQKSATLSWDLTDAQNGGKDHINSWKVEYKLSSDDDWTVAESTLAKATLTKTISDLNCNTDYDFRVSANVQSGYCDIVKEWTSQKTTKFTITKDETGGGGITLSPAATSVCDGDVIDVTANTPDGSHEGTGTIKVIKTGVLPVEDVTSTVYNQPSAGKLTMPAYDITISATYTEKQTPSAGASPAALDFGSPKKGASVAAKTFNLTGSALTVGTLTLVAPSGFTVSPSSITIASAGNLSATEITVTPNTGTAGNFDGNISISGAGVSSTNIVALTMTVQATYTVNWYVNGTDNAHKARTQTDIVNTALTGIPSDFSGVTDCSGKTFMGWTEDDDYDDENDAPADLITSTTGMKITAANKNYYAVFADKDGEDFESWDLVTNASSLQENDIITFTSTCDYNASGTNYKDTVAYAGKQESANLGAVVPIGITNNKIRTVKDGSIRGIKLMEGSAEGTWKLYDLTDKYISGGKKELTYDENSGRDATIAIAASSPYAATVKFGSSDSVLSYNPNTNKGTYSLARFAHYSGVQKAIQIYKKTVTSATYSNYVVVCPHYPRVTLSAAYSTTPANGSISFAVNSEAVTNVRTDGDDAVVDVVASPTTGYELTGLTLTSDDVTGATKNQALTQITIPEDEEGTLTVTATFAQKNYSIAVESYPASIGATLTGTTSTAKYGVEQTISTNEPTGYIFGGWYMYDAEDTGKETDLSEELFTGTYAGGELELEASFLMPDKNLVAEAYFDEIHDVAWALENTPSSGSSAKVYVKGLISKIDSYQSSTITYWISDNGQHVNGTVLEVFKGKGVDNANFTAIGNLTVGDEVIVYGQLKTYSGTKEFDQGNYLYSRTAASLSSVVVSAPDASLVKTEYFGTTETFSYAGLKATAEYNTGYQKDVTDDATWKANGSASLTVATGGTVNVTATYGGETSSNYGVAVTVTTKTLESITVSPAALTGYKGQALPKPTTVTANFDDQGVASSSNVTAQAVYDEAGDYSASSTSAQTIAVKYTFGPTTKSANYTVTLSSIENTLNTAYSVTEARAIIDLDQVEGNDLDLANNLVYVEGIITAKTTNEITIKDVTDATKTIVLYKSTLGTGISSVDVNDRIKALGVLKLYNNTKYEMDEDCEIVWKQPKVGITIANKTLEVGDVWTIAATIDPAAAPVTYSIKDGSDDCVTLATNVITATAEGTATIIASAEAYDDGVNTYAANSKEFTITVYPAAIHTNVVLLAEYNGTYYALKNDASTVTVEMSGGMVVVANEATKNAIIWDRAEREGVATFKNGDNYLNANGSNDMTVSDTEVSWNWNSTYYRKGTDVRTFLYQAGNVNKIKYYAVSNAGNANYSNLPIIYTGKVAIKIAPTGDDPVTKDEDDVPSNASIVVSNKVTLEINNAKTLDNLTVEAGGTVSGNAALAVNDLTIKTNSGAFAVTGTSGQLTGSVMPVVSGDLFIEIKLCDGDMDAEASRKWYCISAPFNVNMNGGFFWGDGTPMVLNTHFQLFEWDGDRRAGGSSGWKRVSGTMKAGIAYFIGFDDERSNQNTIKLKAMSNTISNKAKIEAPTHTGSAEAATYGNWNGLANPNFHHIALNKNVQAFDYNKQGYSPYATGEYNFVVGTPFFIQYAGDIAISAANGSNPYRAPKRESDLYSYCVRIGSASEAVADNQIYVRASETASAEYDSEREMITLNGTTSNYGALLWTVNYGGKRLAIEEAPFVGDKATYALSLYAPADGTYRIETPTVREDADLYLTYEGSIIWNLSAGAYEVELGKGATNEYGLMMVRKAPQVTTGVETIDNSQFTIHNCQKVILNDHVYILRDGQLYDVTGKAVK